MELVFEPRQPDSEFKFLLSGHPARTVSLDGVGSGTVGDPEVQWMVSGFGASVYLCSCALLCLVTQSCPILLATLFPLVLAKITISCHVA